VWVAVRRPTRCWAHLLNPESTLTGGGDEGKAAGRIIVMWVSMGVGVGGHLVVDETLGVSKMLCASCHPDSPSTGNEGEAAGVATQIIVMWVWRIGSAWGQRGVSVGMGGHSVVDETLGASRHPGSPSTGGGNEGEAAGVATHSVVDKTLGASSHPDSPSTGVEKRARRRWVATQSVVR